MNDIKANCITGFQLNLITVKRRSVKNSSDVTNVGNEVIAWVSGGISTFGVLGGGVEGELRNQNQADHYAISMTARNSSDALNRRRLNCVIHCRNRRGSEQKFVDYRMSSKPEEMCRKYVRSVRILCNSYRAYSYNQ